MDQAYLQKSVYCDFDHPAVSSLARDLTKDEPDTARAAEAAFKHVRDSIRFGLDLVRVKASETQAKGYGVCYNKTLSAYSSIFAATSRPYCCAI